MIINKLKLNLKRCGITPTMDAAQGDVLSRGLELSLFDGAKPYLLPENLAVLIRYKKADGKGGEYDTMPDGSPAWSAEGNRLTILLTRQMFTFPGSVSMTIALVSGGTQISTFPVQINVLPEAKALSADSEDYFNITGFLVAPGNAETGQFLQVKAVNSEGRVTQVGTTELEQAPSDWNAAEGEPGHILNRPFYSVAGTTVEILPETRPIYVEAEDMFITGNIPALTAGAEYTVNWNGTAYPCTASAIPIAEGIEVIVLGDVGMMENGTPETGEPFCILVFPAEMDGSVGIVPLDGTTELVLSILGIGETVVPIPQKYLGDLRAQKKYIIDRDQGITPSLEALWKMDTAELQAALVWIEGGTEKNVTIVSRADVEEDGIRYHQIYLSVPVDGARINYYRWTSGGIILVRESWIPAALPKGIGGTFMLVKQLNEEQARWWRVDEVALPGIVLSSTTLGSAKKFLITVDDNGNLTATQK